MPIAPGPLAIQVGIYVCYLRSAFGARGSVAGLSSFPISSSSPLWVRSELPAVTAVFYGVSLAVIAPILHSCYRRAKLGMEDRLQWALAAICFFVTVILQAEVALLFIGAGIVGILYSGSLFRRLPPAAGPALAAPVLAQLAPVASGSTIGKLLLFFLKAGSLTFGSGLVIVAFLSRHAQPRTSGHHRDFRFFWGSFVSRIAIFLPSFLLVLMAAPIFARHRGDTNVQGFIRGAYAAAIGTILARRFPVHFFLDHGRHLR